MSENITIEGRIVEIPEITKTHLDTRFYPKSTELSIKIKNFAVSGEAYEMEVPGLYRVTLEKLE